MDFLNSNVIVNFYPILLMVSLHHLTNLLTEMFIEHVSLRVDNFNGNSVSKLAFQRSSGC